MLTSLPAGHVGTVVTFMAMDAEPEPEAGAPPDWALRLEHWEAPETEAYRTLFARVGGPWLWYSRLAMDDAALRRAWGEVYRVLDREGVDAGLVELDLAAPGECLIRFLALAPELAGRGHGRGLIVETLRRAWRPGVARVVLQTCSLDHPAAMRAYLRAGFRPVRRAFESFPDPRLAGLLPMDAAPHVPILP